MSDLYAIISNKYLKCSVITTSQASALHLQKFSSCFVGVSRPLLQDFWHQMVDTRATLFQYSFRTRVRQFSFIFFFFFDIFQRRQHHPSPSRDSSSRERRWSGVRSSWTELYRKFDAQHFSLAKPPPRRTVRGEEMKPPKFATSN